MTDLKKNIVYKSLVMLLLPNIRFMFLSLSFLSIQEITSLCKSFTNAKMLSKSNLRPWFLKFLHFLKVVFLSTNISIINIIQCTCVHVLHCFYFKRTPAYDYIYYYTVKKYVQDL